MNVFPFFCVRLIMEMPGPILERSFKVSFVEARELVGMGSLPEFTRSETRSTSAGSSSSCLDLLFFFSIKTCSFLSSSSALCFSLSHSFSTLAKHSFDHFLCLQKPFPGPHVLRSDHELSEMNLTVVASGGCETKRT